MAACVLREAIKRVAIWRPRRNIRLKFSAYVASDTDLGAFRGLGKGNGGGVRAGGHATPLGLYTSDLDST
eukprot:1367568-Amorphochlora_amoeboformis.AAC.1